LPEPVSTLDADEIRALGHRTVDLLAELLTATEFPALRRASPEEMAQRISAPVPEQPEDFDALLEQLRRDVLPFMSRLDHPGYFAFIPACGTFRSRAGSASLRRRRACWSRAARRRT